MRNPLISVAMPIYNGQEYLAEAIDSILAQTLTDFELIMIDDGSTDNSAKILKKYEYLDSRIKVISRENRGLATTLNELIDMANGTWLARMDQDDIALPNRFDKQLDWLIKTQADIAGSWVQRFGTFDKRLVKLPQNDEAIKIEMLFHSPFAHPAVMMKTELVRHLRYDKNYEKAEDYDLWVRAALAGWKMTNVPEVLLFYRVHQLQISSATSMKQQHVSFNVQYRYWKYICDLLSLDVRAIDEVLNIRKSVHLISNMDMVDSALNSLLQHGNGNREVQKVILSHAIRLYYRIAADCPDILSRWRKLHLNIDEKITLVSFVMLWILKTLKLRPDSKVFSLFKRFYIFVVS